MATYVNIYECPRGCKAQGGKPIAATVRGWKKHMTRSHEGYTEEELQAILGQAPAPSESGKAEFLAADNDVVTPSLESQEKTTEQVEAERVTIKTDATAKKLSAKMNKFKKSIAEKIPEAINMALKDKGPEWQLTQEDKDMVAESVENCFDVLDIDFQIRPIETVLTSPLWVLLMPLAALAVVFGMKAAKIKKEETWQNSDSATNTVS